VRDYALELHDVRIHEGILVDEVHVVVVDVETKERVGRVRFSCAIWDQMFPPPAPVKKRWWRRAR
jgi:hypothetical protein